MHLNNSIIPFAILLALSLKVLIANRKSRWVGITAITAILVVGALSIVDKNRFMKMDSDCSFKLYSTIKSKVEIPTNGAVFYFATTRNQSDRFYSYYKSPIAELFCSNFDVKYWYRNTSLSSRKVGLNEIGRIDTTKSSYFFQIVNSDSVVLLSVNQRTLQR